MKEIEVSDKFIETLQKLGEAAGVRKDWFELGAPEDEECVCGVYAKDDAEGEKVMDWIMNHCEVIEDEEKKDED